MLDADRPAKADEDVLPNTPADSDARQQADDGASGGSLDDLELPDIDLSGLGELVDL